ncbi:MAG: IS256 family transposase [Tetragenococcus koreensis]|nr:IS256 family transposase [Tetragenococcus koreensis]
MTQLNFNINFEELTEAIMQSDMNMMMKSLAVTVFNAYMEVERDEFIQAKNYERNDHRLDYRNGYYERDFTLAVGKLRLKIPRTRSGEFSTKIFEQYQRKDQAFVLSLMEAVVQGVSTQKVTHIVEQLCGESVSKSFVSNTMKRLDPEIQAFKNRSLTYSSFRYVYVDAMYIKVREDHRVVSKGVYIAQGVNQKNRREILGFQVSEEESTTSWKRFFQDLRERGLTQPRLIISDAHAGLKKAIQEIFTGTAWQRCTVHFLRNMIDQMPKKNNQEARYHLKKIFRANTLQEAKEARQKFEDHVQDDTRYKTVLALLDQGFYDGLQYLSEPEDYHVSLRTTNSLERLNREVRRREKVVSIFPNVDSAERLIGAVLMDIHQAWQKAPRAFLKGPVLGKEDTSSEDET